MVISAVASAVVVAGAGWAAISFFGVHRPTPIPSAIPRPSAAPPPPTASTSIPPPPTETSAAPPPTASSGATVLASFPKVTLELPGTMTADQQKKWESRAGDLGACSKLAAGSCAQKVTVSRARDAKLVVQPAAADCKAPHTIACVEKAVSKTELPADSKVGITFRQ